MRVAGPLVEESLDLVEADGGLRRLTFAMFEVHFQVHESGYTAVQSDREALLCWQE